MKTKVMAIISNINDGGAQKVLLNQAKILQNDETIEFIIYSYEKPTGSVYDKEIENSNLKVVYLNKERHLVKFRFLGDILNFFVTNYNWYKAIKAYKPDVIHTHVTEILRKSFIGIQLSGVKKKYSTLHSNPLRYNGTSYLAAKIAFNYFKFIPVCITKEQAKIATNHYRFKRYELVRNGLDFRNMFASRISREKARCLLDISEDQFVICSVGRLEKIKNIEFLIDVFKNILNINTDAVLVIAGDGSERKTLEEKVISYKLKDKVIFTGNINDVITLYCAADVFCMTSISEASPMALHEAQYCGLKCVITDGVPKENVFSDRVILLNLNDSLEVWRNAILKSNDFLKPVSNIEDFDINKIKERLKTLYIRNDII